MKELMLNVQLIQMQILSLIQFGKTLWIIGLLFLWWIKDVVYNVIVHRKFNIIDVRESTLIGDTLSCITNYFQLPVKSTYLVLKFTISLLLVIIFFI